MNEETKRTNNTPSEPNGERAGQPLLCDSTSESINIFGDSISNYGSITTMIDHGSISTDIEIMSQPTKDDLICKKCSHTIFKVERKTGKLECDKCGEISDKTIRLNFR
jgi:hypothetical protein